MDYIIRKLKSNTSVANLLSHMKKNNVGMYIAGGALTSISVGKSNEIEDYDCYFDSKQSCVEAIRYMKELNPHVAFISDKSITYVMPDETKIQFVYYDFYATSKDIFSDFDFTINMAAYDCLLDEVFTHDNFWMHNSQRHLSINVGTKFPIITMLRLDKYKSKGYTSSRNEILKLTLTLTQLEINTWEDFAAQIGNSYGLNLADLTNTENEDFTIDKGVERIQSIVDGEEFSDTPLPMQQSYLHEPKVIDFIILDEPLEYVTVNGKKHYVDPYVASSKSDLMPLVQSGALKEIEVDKNTILVDKYYVLGNDGVSLGDVIKPSYFGNKIYTKKDLAYNHNGNIEVLVEVEYNEEDVNEVYNTHLVVKEYTIKNIICRKGDVHKWKDGEEEVKYVPQVRDMPSSSVSPKGWAFSEDESFQRGKIAQIADMRQDYIKEHVVITTSESGYAHKKVNGVILKGGGDIEAYELLLHLDNYNLCFGGSCSINNIGRFNAKIHTD